MEGSLEKLAGELWFMPNDINHRKQVSICLVGVKTDFNSITNVGIDYTTANPSQVQKIEDLLAKYYNQALIDVNCISTIKNKSNATVPFEIDATLPTSTQKTDPFSYDTLEHDYGNTTSPTYPTRYLYISSAPNSGSITLHDKLYKIITSSKAITSYNDEFVFFYIKEIFNDKATGMTLYGECNPNSPDVYANTVILFRGNGVNGNVGTINSLYDKTSVHEGWHDLELQHPFGNQYDFTFKKFMTDNIMDYSLITGNDNPNPTTEISSWRVQWDKIKQGNILKASNY